MLFHNHSRILQHWSYSPEALETWDESEMYQFRVASSGPSPLDWLSVLSEKTESQSTSPTSSLLLFVAVYPNGTVIKRVTACKYAKYEYADTETGLCLSSYCAQSNLFCPKPEPLYKVPAALTKRGLEVGESLVLGFYGVSDSVKCKGGGYFYSFLSKYISIIQTVDSKLKFCQTDCFWTGKLVNPWKSEVVYLCMEIHMMLSTLVSG